VRINEQRSRFFEKLALLNAGALTFSVTLLTPATPGQPTYPPILIVLQGGWVCLLIALGACLLRNLANQGYRYYDAVAKMQQSEIEYIDADTALIQAGRVGTYSDSTDRFDAKRELAVNSEKRAGWEKGMGEAKARADRNTKIRRVAEWVVGVSMPLGFLLLVVFSILKTYLG
jgi:hypothetical protein